jgi:hypothetical protein
MMTRRRPNTLEFEEPGAEWDPCGENTYQPVLVHCTGEIEPGALDLERRLDLRLDRRRGRWRWGTWHFKNNFFR